LHLDRQEMLSLSGDHRGRTIYCQRGAIWLTQPDDPNDYCLTAGQELTISRRGRIIAQGLEESCVELR
jgi:hypothetical protein